MNDDPVVVLADAELDAEAGRMEAAIPVDSPPNPPNDAAKADEAAGDVDADDAGADL